MRGAPNTAAAGPFLEREAPLATVEELLARARSGTGGLLVVEGPAGLGKSRLLDVAAARARHHGMDVLAARGEELEQSLPWGLARRLLGPDVVPAAADVLTAAHELSWVVAGRADARPLVLSVDDGHWVDEPSLRLLGYLLGRLDDLPVAVLLARRPREPGAERQLLETIVADPRAERVTLPPLSEDAVDLVVRNALGDRVGDGLSAACAATTRGNPFYLCELLRELQLRPTEEALDPQALHGLTPETVSRAVFLRLARLPPEATTLARAVATLGDRTEFPLACALAELDPATATRAFDALAGTEILGPAEPLGFVHPLVAQAVHEDIGAGARGTLHRRAAELLDRGGGAPEAVATHLLQAGHRGDPWVVSTLRAAADHALAQGATTAAAEWLTRALEEPPPSEERAALLLELGRAEAALGRAGAVERLEAAAALTVDDEQYARACADLGRALGLQGRAGDAAAAFQRGRDRLDDPDSELDKELRAAWWSAATLEATLRAQAREVPAPILPRAGERLTPGERELLAQLAIQRAFEGAAREQVIELAERAWDGGELLAQGAGDGLTWSLVTGALLVADAVERGLEVCDVALTDARRRGSPMGFANACYCRSWPLLALGRVNDAIADAQAALNARHDGWSAFLGTAAALLLFGQVERGDLAGARETLAIVEDDPTLRTSNQYPMLEVAAGRLLVAEGRPAEALQRLLAAGELLAQADIDCPSAVPWHADATLAAGLAGEREQARSLAAGALASARRGGAPTAIARALRASARTERGEAALTLHREAVATLDPYGPRLERAHALVDLGAALRRARRRAEARGVLQEGLTQAEAGGALALAETARVELAAAGARASKEPRSGLASLTPSERRVAEMAATGMTNRAIAQALFVTVKAIEYHLANAYRKLDIHTRAQLAPLLGAALPLVPDGAEP